MSMGTPSAAFPGAIANGVDEATAQAIYDEILDFANYAFNKAHAVCYALVSYQTAYLKCHFPRQYMAALMTSVLDSAAKISEYIAECKSMGISVLPPDINESEDQFTVVEEGIRFGLAAVKNIGRGLSAWWCGSGRAADASKAWKICASGSTAAISTSARWRT